MRFARVAGLVVAISVAETALLAQGAPDTREAHVAAAKAAAGSDHTNVFERLCTATAAPASQVSPAAAPPPAAPAGAPARSQWHAEPVKVFDNLYFVGQSEFSAWAVTTSAGIILVDTIFDYSVEDQVAGGLKKLGLHPETIK